MYQILNYVFYSASVNTNYDTTFYAIGIGIVLGQLVAIIVISIPWRRERNRRERKYCFKLAKCMTGTNRAKLEMAYRHPWETDRITIQEYYNNQAEAE